MGREREREKRTPPNLTHASFLRLFFKGALFFITSFLLPLLSVTIGYKCMAVSYLLCKKKKKGKENIDREF